MDIEIKEGKISKIINALKPDKSQGPDRIHPRILKETNQFVKLLLEKIFRKSLDETYMHQSIPFLQKKTFKPSEHR